MIGGELCRQWNMPDFVADAVTYHHSPKDSEDNLLVKIIHSADTLAHILSAEPIEETMESLDSSALPLINIEKEELLVMAEEILDAVEELEEDTY
jgi:HD-like signal output (HDOD) protein